MHPPPATQLDLFAHSRDVMLRNDMIDALLRRDADPSQAAQEAQAALAAWSAEFPGDPGLGDGGTLLAVLQGEGLPPAPPPDAGALLSSREALAGPIAAAAGRLLGSATAAEWLLPCWAALARRAAGLPFDAQTAAIHPAALWLQARDWVAAATAVESIESWRRIPAPLAWMTQARWRLAGPDAAWPLLAELAWLAPARFIEVTSGLRDPALLRLLRRFESDFDAGELPDGWAWLPAWALTELPLLAEPMAAAVPSRQTAAEQGWQRMQALLRLERSGRHAEIIEHRKRLRDLNPGLFEAYMRSR